MEDQIQGILSHYKYPERMQSSQLFHDIVISIASGKSPHVIIEALVTIIEDQREELEKKPKLIQASVPLTDEQVRTMLERRMRVVPVPDHLNKLPITPGKAFPK